MKLVKVIPETYLEYEDHLSIVLFSFGCNLHCSYCYNYTFVTDPANLLKESAESLLDMYYHPLIDGLVFLGGEPTLYPDRLEEIALYAKEKYGLETKLFTNGTNPDLVLKGLTEGWLDNVSIDLKTIKDDSLFLVGQNPYKQVLSLLQDVHKNQFNNKVEVRTTLYGGDSEEQDLNIIQEYCSKYQVPHLVQKCFEGLSHCR